MIRWPDLSRFGAEAVVFGGLHGVRVESPDEAFVAALGGDRVTDDGIVLLPPGKRLNIDLVVSAFPDFTYTDIKEIISIDEVDVLKRPYLIEMPFGTNSMAGISAFEAARHAAEWLARDSIVRLQIRKVSGPYLDSAVNLLHAAFVSNGDGTATFAQEIFPASKEPLTDDRILHLATEERVRWAPADEPESVPKQVLQPASAVQSQPEVKKPNGRIEDVGAKIGGARKDFAKNALRIEDAENMTDAEREKLITLANIWPFSIRDAIDNGMEPGVVRYILDSRKTIQPYSAFRKIGSRGEHTEEDMFSHYIGFAEALRDNLSSVKTKTDLAEGVAAFYKDERYKEGKAWRDGSVGYFFSNKSWKWLADTLIGQLDHEGRRIGGYVGSPRGWTAKHSRLSDPDAREYAIGKLLPTRTAVKVENDIEARVARPHLDALVDDYLDGVDHNPQELIDRFGFKAVEFGNWLPQDERQRVVNHAVAAFKFLSEVLELPEEMLSLGGELSLAFGARGTGGKRAPMAHYEGLRRVMNLTRLSGAGSLAHEYGHAMDNFLGESSKSWRGFFTDTSFSPVAHAAKCEIGTGRAMKAYGDAAREIVERQSGWALSWMHSLVAEIPKSGLLASTPPKAVDLLDGILIDSMTNLVPNISPEHISAAMARRVTAEAEEKPLLPFLIEELESSGFVPSHVAGELEGVFEVATDRLAKHHVKLRDFFSANKKSAHWQVQANMRTVMKEATTLMRLLSPQSREKLRDYAQCSSRFLEDAKKIDEARSKPYWSTDIELFARAFEQFVFYEAKDRGLRVDYLVHSVEVSDSEEPSAYPREYDRLAMREVIREKFIPSLQKALCAVRNEASPVPSM